MSAILNSLLKVDLSKISEEIQKGLQTGEMTLSASNGVVYGPTGRIVKFLPMVPVSPQDLASAEQLLGVGQAMNGAKVAAVSATAIGTAVVVVAVVVATAYLAGKIDKVECSVKEVAQIVGQQDQREYLKDVSNYTGAIMAGSELLQSRAPQSEIAMLAELRINKLNETRHQMLSYIQHLTRLISSPEKATRAQHDLALQFMIGVLDLMPSALAVERELCLAAGKPALAKECCRGAASEFRKALAEFRKSCDEQYRQLALGEGGFADVLVAHRGALNALFNSPVHDLLLGDRDTTFAWKTASASADSEMMESSATGSDRQSRSN